MHLPVLRHASLEVLPAPPHQDQPSFKIPVNLPTLFASPIEWCSFPFLTWVVHLSRHSTFHSVLHCTGVSAYLPSPVEQQGRSRVSLPASARFLPCPKEVLNNGLLMNEKSNTVMFVFLSFCKQPGVKGGGIIISHIWFFKLIFNSLVHTLIFHWNNQIWLVGWVNFKYCRAPRLSLINLWELLENGQQLHSSKYMG